MGLLYVDQVTSILVQIQAIRTICDSLSIPVVANGDIKCMDDVQRVQKITGVKGAAVSVLKFS